MRTTRTRGGGSRLRAEQGEMPPTSSALDRARTGQFPHTLLTMDEAAEYIGGFAGQRRADSCRNYLQQNGAKLLRVGRGYRVRVRTIDELLDTGMGDLDREAERRVGDLERVKR